MAYAELISGRSLHLLKFNLLGHLNGLDLLSELVLEILILLRQVIELGFFDKLELLLLLIGRLVIFLVINTRHFLSLLN